MVDEQVNHFNKRVQNLCLAYDIQKAFTTIKSFCELSMAALAEINDFETKKFI